MCGSTRGASCPEESGRLVTAFLERFFERYVSYDYTAELEEELDDVSGGRLDWQKLLDDFWRDFKPKAGEVMDQKPSRDHRRRSTSSSRPGSIRRAPTAPTRASARNAATAGCSLRGGKFGAFVACSNYPECRYTQKFGQGGDQAQSDGPHGARRRHLAQDRAVRPLCRARRASARRSPRTCRSRT